MNNLSEEEKQAIEVLKHWIKYEKENKEKIVKADELINIQETILALVDKQQKEIEELKENYDKLFEKYEMKKVLFIRKDHITQKLLTELYIRKDILNDYISKDKIREKIKILEEQDKASSFSGNYLFIDVLKELLEE